MNGSVRIRRTSLAAILFITGGLLWSASPAHAIGPTEIRVACSVQTPYAPNATYRCGAWVGDADPGADPDPTGTVAFYLDGINTLNFLGQCALAATPATPGGLSVCGFVAVSVPPGPHTVWAIYYPASGSPYSIGVGSDDVGNPAVGPPDPTDTTVLCVPTAAAGTAQPLDCVGFVVDDDSDPGPSFPMGTVALYRNGINTLNFVGQGALPNAGTTGISVYSLQTTAVPPGASTIWAVYYGDANYQASVGNDQVNV